jgi:hypothetical protein
MLQTDDYDVNHGFMFEDEEYDSRRYEDPQIKELRKTNVSSAPLNLRVC